jgi:peptidoglycan-associated lipoprotein
MPDTRTPSPQSGAAMSPRGADGQRPSARDAFGRIPPSEFSAKADLLDIHLAFDRYDVSSEAARILDANAVWSKTHTRTLLLIEGHTDERGTSEYNLALGERCAAAAKNYLVSQGVHAARITTISYGKEWPVCREGNETCWAKNRRAHFLVNAK